MSRESNEEKISSILKKIKGKKKQEGLKEFFDYFSDDIYSYPIRYFNLNEDEAGDFYLYAFERLKDGKRLSSFKGESKFTTWFFSVLRNLCIDFLRTKREHVKTVSLIRMDPKGNLVDLIGSIPDKDFLPTSEQEEFEKLEANLATLKMEERVLFKLAYILYLDLTSEELEWLRKKNGVRMQSLIKKLAELKDKTLKKSDLAKEIDDKLSYLFRQITALERKIVLAFQEHPEWPYESDKWSETYENSKLPPEIIEQIQTLMKKKARHLSLLKEQRKKITAAKAPYADVADLMKSSKGVVSVQLLRLLEKLQKMHKSLS
ncbi:MAG: sigma-70 family RNA polymerase sigma factor [Candidatus Hydrogenedentota bacterium]|nr:MAG: sigma-70 family RNA polymerase sigma factor [Candidatus Hydrogenedentota bacterium]